MNFLISVWVQPLETHIQTQQYNFFCNNGQAYLEHPIQFTNGGEFVSEDVIDFRENFSINIKTTPAESPWNNGVCERHNAIITEMLLKVKNDCQCDWETALA